jgi:hypothetical protein
MTIPALDDALLRAFISLYLAFAYRLRGHRPDTGILNRLMHPVFTLRPFWALSTYGSVWLLTGHHELALLLALGEWLALHIPHAKGQNFGEPNDGLRNYLVGLQRGGVHIIVLTGATHWGYLVGVPLADPGSFFLVAIVLLNGLAEGTGRLMGYHGWRVGAWPYVPHILRGHLEWQEWWVGLLKGAMFGLLLERASHG